MQNFWFYMQYSSVGLLQLGKPAGFQRVPCLKLEKISSCNKVAGITVALAS